MSVAPNEAPARVTNHSTRCDRCSARAYVVVILKRSRRLRRGGELFACAHHWREWMYAISPRLAHVIDETDALREGITDDKHVN